MGLIGKNLIRWLISSLAQKLSPLKLEMQSVLTKSKTGKNSESILEQPLLRLSLVKKLQLPLLDLMIKWNLLKSNKEFLRLMEENLMSLPFLNALVMKTNLSSCSMWPSNNSKTQERKRAHKKPLVESLPSLPPFNNSKLDFQHVKLLTLLISPNSMPLMTSLSTQLST